MSPSDGNNAKPKARAFLLPACPTSVIGTSSEAPGSLCGSTAWGWVGMGVKCAVRRSRGIHQVSPLLNCSSNQIQLWKHKVLSHFYAKMVSPAARPGTQHPRGDLNQLLEAIWDLQEWGWAWNMACGAGDTWKLNVPSCHSLLLSAFFSWWARKNWCAVVEMQQRHLLLWFHSQCCSATAQLSIILNGLLSVQRHLNRF